MIEFDVDMGYLLEAGELDRVVLNDENGEHEPMEFRPSGGECELEIKDNMDESEGTGAVWWECSSCHWQIEFFHTKWLKNAKFCPQCGRKIRKAVER